LAECFVGTSAPCELNTETWNTSMIIHSCSMIILLQYDHTILQYDHTLLQYDHTLLQYDHCSMIIHSYSMIIHSRSMIIYSCSMIIHSRSTPTIAISNEVRWTRYALHMSNLLAVKNRFGQCCLLLSHT
jgi:hypothetical protein